MMLHIQIEATELETDARKQPRPLTQTLNETTPSSPRVVVLSPLRTPIYTHRTSLPMPSQPTIPLISITLITLIIYPSRNHPTRRQAQKASSSPITTSEDGPLLDVGRGIVWVQ